MKNEHFVNKTNTTEDEKDMWQTPQYLFDSLNKEFDFKTDICADYKNALCDRFFTAENSALDNNWSNDGAAFINPPYSETQRFLSYAASQAKEFNLTVVALVNANTDTKWFLEASKTANEIRLISGRIGFIKPDGKKANGNTKGQCIIIWRGKCKTPCVISIVERDVILNGK